MYRINYLEQNNAGDSFSRTMLETNSDIQAYIEYHKAVERAIDDLCDSFGLSKESVYNNPVTDSYEVTRTATNTRISVIDMDPSNSGYVFIELTGARA